jgi:hypothetical protein
VLAWDIEAIKSGHYYIIERLTQHSAINCPIKINVLIEAWSQQMDKTNLGSNRPVQIVPLSLHLCSGSSKMQRGSGKCTPSARTLSCILPTIICKLRCCTLWHKCVIELHLKKWICIKKGKKGPREKSAVLWSCENISVSLQRKLHHGTLKVTIMSVPPRPKLKCKE